MLYAVIVSGLLSMDRSNFTDKTKVESLFTLVPTLLLLLFSIYNKNFFIADEESEKKSGLLADLDLMNVNTVKKDKDSGNAKGPNLKADKESKSARAIESTEKTPLLECA